MLLSLLAFSLAALALFFSSQALLSRLFRRLPLNLVFFLLLPGIFLHEFSHILMAEILRVKTGELKLKPEIVNGHLTLGSAQIALTDPFRLTLIGIAPFIAGTASLWLLLNLVPKDPVYLLLITYYLVFAIANTLFSSASDLQAAAVPLILVLLILGGFSLTNLSLPPDLIPAIQVFFFNLARVFAYTLGVNLVLLLPLKLLRKKVNMG
ncbi:hypothetical protein COW80_04840 [Candidatus Beckwithbacteria bacterium CG22_combo_CG10-13_8_21_14_all_01_47_9]|uniref:Uncharacterized protein n=4 Tax=Candidatus Beckwithiibacteriota TaxID=1752726 RepID=A0A2H0DZL6_9BACT|nr:MAG: hypothetical protein AUJ59_04260 [Candidatus Beckwithbacteria bacterium CG1_02_47_37]PIP87623.1 MAG: hypothetical protein COW80_04840 [Candidatus Beckwithbacteria bacterium CG22_combo_CG10-13_8_21_14_all_01_47_9]PJA21434.1 MAG: hypothetical protein COX59_04260 [Candidatus Beckwithbacteria bacterium CG_4_10_14_0_2_um_filter_47_25]PJC66557.1 MAG: hypothetical protein CO018_01270 [Candidatus Beckwithbacteria bacterium CG_4_9_14_0_2_um_filter_47_11]